MKFFVVFACALAVASAGYLHPVHHGAQHLAVIGADGVPVDTAAVQQSKAEHSIHRLNAQVRNGDLVHGVVAQASPVVSAYAGHYGVPAVVSNAYAYPQHVPVIGATGVPVETPEVQHAKAAHLIAKAEVAARNGVYAHGIVSHSAVAHQVPVIANGVPVDTIEVQHAKAAHFAAKAEIAARDGLHAHHGVVAHSALVAPVAHHVPVIANGVPVETPEVQLARAAHLAAHAKVANPWW